MKEEHANAIKEIAKDMEKKAMTKLTETSRRALEENTMLLRQVYESVIETVRDKSSPTDSDRWLF